MSCQTLYTFFSGIKKPLTLLTYPFHHFFIVFIYYWGGYSVTFNNISKRIFRNLQKMSLNSIQGPFHSPCYPRWSMIRNKCIFIPFHHFFIVFIYYWGGYSVTFNNISIISWRSVLVVNETGVPGENHRPIASHWQTFWGIIHVDQATLRTGSCLLRS
jgi:ammonia channel protein AmtB